MRNLFTKLLLESFKKDERVYLLTSDLGFKMWDEIEYWDKSRFVKMGSSEQLMIGAAVGLAHSNKIPVCYSISTFLLNRPYEWLRNYVNYENLNVKLVGSGRDKDYIRDGITHWSIDDESVLKQFSNISIYKPKTEDELTSIFDDFLNSTKPAYLNLKRN